VKSERQRGKPRTNWIAGSVLLLFAMLAPPGAFAQDGVAPSAAPDSTAAPAPKTVPAHTAASTGAGATYIGADACLECHDGIEASWKFNPHHGAVVAGAPGGNAVGCESCHGPGSLHAGAAGEKDDPNFATINMFGKMKPAAAAAVCATCHKTGQQFYWAQSAHSRNDVACQSCHSIHAAKAVGGKALLRAERPTALCVTCHSEKRAEISRTAHMPLKEGGMDCSSCHNPHGSPGEKMIRAVSNNELCTSCHMDKRGPFLWEHAPVRENCVTCHMPHGSNNDKVLASKRPFLCQRCHIASRHPSDLYDRPDLVSNRLFNRSCTNCHSQIHGSNHPSGKTFLR